MRALAELEHPRPGTPGPSLLVVEAGDFDRRTASANATAAGWNVHAVASVVEALQLMRRKVFDVVLVGLGVEPHLAHVEQVSRAHPAASVLATTSWPSVPLAVAVVKAGASDLLTRPLPPRVLERALARALADARAKAPAEVAHWGLEDATGLVGRSPAMGAIRALIASASRGAVTVLIEGETGSGKEAVARALHEASARAGQPFVQINCAAVPEHLLESELFGHERGAFTDAPERKPGLLERAEGGTLLLDEIGDTSAAGQAQVLRLLEDHRSRRVSASRELRSSARVVAATGDDLEGKVAEGAFCADLFRHLNVLRIRIPPLRERPDDIGPLAAHLIARFNQQMGHAVRGLSAQARAAMRAYHWPGNVRELSNVIERAMILHAGTEIGIDHLPQDLQRAEAPSPKHRRGKLLDPTSQEAQVILSWIGSGSPGA